MISSFFASVTHLLLPSSQETKDFFSAQSDLADKTTRIWDEKGCFLKEKNKNLKVHWSDPLATCTEVPNRKYLDITKLWYDSHDLGYEAMLSRNNQEELLDYSNFMLSLDCLSE